MAKKKSGNFLGLKILLRDMSLIKCVRPIRLLAIIGGSISGGDGTIVGLLSERVIISCECDKEGTE